MYPQLGVVVVVLVVSEKNDVFCLEVERRVNDWSCKYDGKEWGGRVDTRSK